MSQIITDRLDTKERSQWRKLRTRCQSRMTGLWELVSDLRVIRDQRLYREEFKTFESFLRDELGMERTYAHRMIEASETRERLLPIGDKFSDARSITKEGQLRELKHVPDEKLGDVVERAAVIASHQEKPITAQTLRVAREEVLSELEEDPDESITEPAAATLSDVEMALKNAIVGKECLNAIRHCIKLVKSVTEAPGTELLVSRQRSIINDLENARNAVKVAIPKSICPRCSGKKCAQCGNWGWVNDVLERELRK